MRDAVIFLYQIGKQVFEIVGSFDVDFVEENEHSNEVEQFIESVMSGDSKTFKLYSPQTVGQHPDGSTAFATVLRMCNGMVTFRSSDVLSMSRASVLMKKDYVDFLLGDYREPEDEGLINKDIGEDSQIH
jgi:hypothetical protein